MSTRLTVYIPDETAQRLDALVWDPVRQRVRHRARSRLVAHLLHTYLESLHGHRPNQEPREPLSA